MGASAMVLMPGQHISKLHYSAAPSAIAHPLNTKIPQKDVRLSLTYPET